MPCGFFSLLRIQLRTYPGGRSGSGGHSHRDGTASRVRRWSLAELEFNELVVTSRLLLDLIGELLQPPVFFVDDLSAFALEDADELCDRLPFT